MLGWGTVTDYLFVLRVALKCLEKWKAQALEAKN